MSAASGSGGGDDVARWGLVLGFVFGAVALATGGAALRWLDGATLRAGVAVFALFLWGAIPSIHYFERRSPSG